MTDFRTETNVQAFGSLDTDESWAMISKMSSVSKSRKASAMAAAALITGPIQVDLAVIASVAIAVFILIRKKNLMKHSGTSSGDFSNGTASTTE